MRHVEPILVRHEHDRPHHWRRFLAALCFMEFYVTFVYAGMAIWDDDPELWFSPLEIVLESPWGRFHLLVGAVMLYVCGRSLWRGGRAERAWLWLGAVTLLSMVACTVVVVVEWSTRPTPAFAFRLAIPTASALDLGFRSGSTYFVLLVVLGVVAWLTRANNAPPRMARAPWVYCATAYCLASIPCGFLGQDGTSTVFYQAVSSLTGQRGASLVADTMCALLLFATGVALLCRWRFARTLALILAAVNVVGVGFNWYPLSWMIRVGVRALMLTVPAALETEPRTLWTQFDLLRLFVDPVRLVGPWLLIAIYAWKATMRQPPDDGTPFPRRFCGKCYYNLHGIEANRCPECGTEFEPPVG